MFLPKVTERNNTGLDSYVVAVTSLKSRINICPTCNRLWRMKDSLAMRGNDINSCRFYLPFFKTFQYQFPMIDADPCVQFTEVLKIHLLSGKYPLYSFF